MIIHNNAPIIFSYLYGWGPIFVISTLLFYPKIFSNKLILINVLFFFLFALILPHILWKEMDEWYSFRQITIFSNLTVAVTLFIWLRNDNNPRVWLNLAKTGLIFIVVTCVMTIIGTIINPIVVRASYSSLIEEVGNFMSIDA